MNKQEIETIKAKYREIQRLEDEFETLVRLQEALKDEVMITIQPKYSPVSIHSNEDTYARFPFMKLINVKYIEDMQVATANAIGRVKKELERL